MADKVSNKSQIEKFIETARALETDESEENFDRILKKIVKSPQQKARSAKPDKP